MGSMAIHQIQPGCHLENRDRNVDVASGGYRYAAMLLMILMPFDICVNAGLCRGLLSRGWSAVQPCGAMPSQCDSCISEKCILRVNRYALAKCCIWLR
jgi:hypothetical protein